MNFDEQTIERIVAKVTQELGSAGKTVATSNSLDQVGTDYQPVISAGPLKFLYDDIDEAVKAAAKAQKELLTWNIEGRKKITDSIKSVCMAHAEEMAKMELCNPAGRPMRIMGRALSL